MDIIKHGQYFKEKEKRIVCNVKCSWCGCEFNLEHSDFPLMIIPEKITLEQFKIIKKIGLGYTVACPECESHIQVHVKLTQSQERCLEEHIIDKEN